MEINYTLLTIIIGITLDTIIGDPYWLPHPIRVFGNMISYLEKKFNKGSQKVLKGALTWLSLNSVVFLAFLAIQLILNKYELVLSIVNGIFFFYCISSRCLIQEGLKVEKYLMNNDLKGARKQLSMIVGRDTDTLTSSQIRSSVIETLSENLSDGVIAPLFFFAIGGIPLMMVYKMCNTLDSMIGYKNEKYKDFGCFSAKADDVTNFIPARLTALIMIIVSLSKRGLIFILKYGKSHSSPNSGYPESAIAGILNCRLGGPNKYFGKTVTKPYIGSNPRPLSHSDIIKTCLINGASSFIGYIIVILISIR